MSTLHELAVASVLLLSLPEDSSWISLGFPTQAFIVGMALATLKDLLEKTSFVLTSLIVFISNRKHRTYLVLNIMIIVGSVFLSPLLAGMILISSVLSAPLLSLFTLPIFSVSFPRTRHFWPGLINFGSTFLKSTEETVYYQQAETEMAKAVHSSISCGAVSPQPGTNVLIRFDNRLVLVTILEVGHGFCTFSMRGLELQETSCHSEEATQIDSIYEAQHNPKSWQQSLFNTSLLSILQPLDTVRIRTYSDAHNVLTGIIDQPSALQRFSSNLIKSLVWVLNKHLKSTNGETDLVPVLSVQDASPHVSEEEEDPIREKDPIGEKSTTSVIALKEDHPKSLLDGGSWSSLSLGVPPDVGTVQKLNAAPAESWYDSTSSGLVPQDIPLDTREPVHVDTILLAGEKLQLSKRISNKVLPEYCSEMDIFSKSLWQPPPLSNIQMYRLMLNFPHDWLSHLNDKVPMDGVLFERLSRTVVGCFSLLDVPAQAKMMQQDAATPLPQTYSLDVYRRFCNDIPYSFHLNWMTDQPILHKLALKSYRCVKGDHLLSHPFPTHTSNPPWPCLPFAPLTVHSLLHHIFCTSQPDMQ